MEHMIGNVGQWKLCAHKPREHKSKSCSISDEISHVQCKAETCQNLEDQVPDFANVDQYNYYVKNVFWLTA